MRVARLFPLLLVSTLLIGSLNACAKEGEGDKGASAYKHAGVIDDEAYDLPPLSEFVPFSAGIAEDLEGKCAAEGLVLGELKRTKGDHRQSVYATFRGLPGTVSNREAVLVAFRVLGRNFADVSRYVIAVPNERGEMEYMVARGSRVADLLKYNAEIDPDAGLDPDRFWETLEHEVQLEGSDAKDAVPDALSRYAKQ